MFCVIEWLHSVRLLLLMLLLFPLPLPLPLTAEWTGKLMHYHCLGRLSFKRNFNWTERKRKMRFKKGKSINDDEQSIYCIWSTGLSWFVVAFPETSLECLLHWAVSIFCCTKAMSMHLAKLKTLDLFNGDSFLYFARH